MNTQNFISSPSEYFPTPDAIVNSSVLTQDEKITALENWEQSCLQLQESSNEGMTASKRLKDRLPEVKEALEELKLQ